MSFFETIGLGLLTNFLSDLLKKKLKFKMNRTDVDKIADRLNLVLSLMNEGRDEKFTVAQFSKILELKKVGDLEKYFINIEELELEFLEIFSQTFAINYEWLTEGKGHPFKCDQQIYISIYDCLERIDQIKPFIIYFVRSQSLRGETCILLEVREHHFIVLNSYIHFSEQVGFGGSCELVAFRKLVMELILVRKYITKGVIVSDQNFKKLYKGEIHPKVALMARKGKFEHWHDDFTDIYNQRYGYRHHGKYDKNFKDAFNIVKNNIEKNGEL